MISTVKKIAQINAAEYQKRNPETVLKFQKKNRYMGKDNYFDEKSWQ